MVRSFVKAKAGHLPGYGFAIRTEHKCQEGGAIPVGSLSLGSVTINRFKLAEILTSTMELRERAIVDIEALFRRAMERAYAKVLDNALLSNAAAVTNVRPAGLLNGVTVGTADATGGIDSVKADMDTLLQALLSANEGARPVLLMNNRNRISLGLVTSDLGEFVFESSVAAGMILNVPIISSGNVPNNTVIMVDASSLAMALDAPMFDISQVATIVEADADGTPPTMADNGSGAAGTAGQVQQGIPVVPNGTPAVAAGYTARSMFQTLASVGSFCGNAVDKLCELLENPTWAISSQAA
jgi:hypothetical protein